MDGVAELVGAAVAAPNDLVVVLVEHVVVVLQAADGYHALALVALDLGVDAPLADTADECREDLPQLVGQELGLLVLHAGALGVGGFLLHEGAVLASLFEETSRRRVYKTSSYCHSLDVLMFRCLDVSLS